MLFRSDTRFDFKGTGTKLEMSGEKINIESETEERAKAALEVLKEKMIKRNVSLKHIDPGQPQQSGKLTKISVALKEGISTENAKKVAKLLKDEGPKSLKTQIQGDELRVISKSRDDLQDTIQLVKDHIISWTNEGDLIYDPFMGSGTTAVACERLGRKWFGCELEPKYVEIANKRIEAERNQLKLF